MKQGEFLMPKIAFVGAGSMAEAIIAGITSKKDFDATNITAMNRSNEERRTFLTQTYGITTTTNYETLLQNAKIVFLAVKPKDILQALLEIKGYIQKDMLIISVIAGVSVTSIEDILQQKIAIIRSMPNTSATIGKSATAITPNESVTEEQLQLAVSLLETIGKVTIVEEKQLDAVTGLSGSGPAYIYYIIEAMESAAEQLGLEKDSAKELIVQTILGAAEMLQHSPKTPAQLRKEVTSPGGTTEAGLNVLQERDVKQSLIDCIVTASKQSEYLGQKSTEEIKEKLLSI